MFKAKEVCDDDGDGEFMSLYTYLGNAPIAAMAAPLFLPIGPARCEAALHSCGISPICLFYTYTIATVLKVYHGSDMMYKTRKRNPEPAF